MEKRDIMNKTTFILAPIQQYFESYYKMLSKGRYLNISKYFIPNEHTIIPQRILQNKLKLYRAFGLKIIDYRLNLEFEEIKYFRDRIAVIVIENAEYKFNNAPKSMTTRLTGVEYYIELKKIKGRWRIIYMDSNHDDYTMAHARSRQYAERNRSTKRKTVFDKKVSGLVETFNELDKKIVTLTHLLKIQRNKGANEREKKQVKQVESYIYNASLGIRYARKYAQYYKLSEDQKLFYYASNGSDCANFVSQCVWAAYGGYTGDTLQSKRNISKKKRMVYTGQVDTSWYGTAPGGGGTPYWENVNHFYHYATSPKGIGPKGIGFGGGKQKDFKFNLVKPGNVLQFWPASKPTWYHSAYVSSTYFTDENYQIYVCQHSMDIKDRPLIEILNWNTNEGHVRGIKFDPTSFSS